MFGRGTRRNSGSVLREESVDRVGQVIYTVIPEMMSIMSFPKSETVSLTKQSSCFSGLQSIRNLVLLLPQDELVVAKKFDFADSPTRRGGYSQVA